MAGHLLRSGGWLVVKVAPVHFVLGFTSHKALNKPLCGEGKVLRELPFQTGVPEPSRI